MAVPKKTHWALDPHTSIKHLILRRYLEAWLPIMGKYHGRILFIDGFAGPGRYQRGEEGSPIIAVRALLDHPHFQNPERDHEIGFFFIEQDAARANALKEELRRLGSGRTIPRWVKIEVRQGDFAEVMTDVLDKLGEKGSRLAPTFAFIDPFGFRDIPMSLIARIARNRKCECLITFMYEAINRFLTTPQQAVQARFDELFGTPEWRRLELEQNPATRRDQIVELYQRQLTTVAHFQYVRTFEMIDSGNHTEYFLYFATNNEKGLSKMKEAMWREDPVQGREFSDRTVTDQMVLIKPSPDLGPLRDKLQRAFRHSGWATIEQVMDFVLVYTPFSENIHLKRLTLGRMERNKPPLIQVRRPAGSPNRAGAYPAGTRIKFV